MCGIALIIDGVHISITHQQTSSPSYNELEPITFTIDDLKAGLQRRGPDSLGTIKVVLEVQDGNDLDLVSYVVGDDGAKKEISCCSAVLNCSPSANKENGLTSHRTVAEMYFIGAVLQLRGINPVAQPLTDASGNVLIYNGEIYAGLHMSGDSNDAEVLFQSLGNCCSSLSHGKLSSCSGKPIPSLLSSLKGPWALVYWQNNTRTLWFGRDAFGRRSLLAHWPTSEDSRFLLSSVSPPTTTHSSDAEADKTKSTNYWEELPCGVYSMHIGAFKDDKCLVGEVMKHEWASSKLNDLIKWDRLLVEPSHHELNQTTCCISPLQADVLPVAAGTLLFSKAAPAYVVLTALRKSIARRTTDHRIFKVSENNSELESLVPVAVLFSGGLDSMILAAILHECLDVIYEIDLLNISFEGETAPDRITARVGVKELKRIAPARRWRLVEIDAKLLDLTMEMKHVTSLINPSNTYMDLNIGLALWLAAGGDGWVYDSENYGQLEGCHRFKYKSKARILLVGSGADEQCAGYGRHRTKYKHSSWLGLHEEMKLDVQRIWKRNLGRDDRCIADTGKEARFPFLDEDVMKILLEFPLWEIANLEKPSGSGDKKILREVARLLGLHEAAVQPKRAIQFGSRIAQESNKRNFGSNRAANQASAGSVVFQK